MGPFWGSTDTHQIMVPDSWFRGITGGSRDEDNSKGEMRGVTICIRVMYRYSSYDVRYPASHGDGTICTT